MNIPVFLSCSTPYTDKQNKFLDEVKAYLRSRCLEPNTLGKTDYDVDEPLAAIRRMMFESNGVLAIAFRRYFIQQGKEKGIKDLANKYFSSPWCQIEPAMAYQLGLPILILREKDVVDDGILEKGVAGIYLPEFDLENPIEDYFRSEEWRQIIGAWEGNVRATRKTKGNPPKLF